MSDTISLKSLDRAEVLAALYNGSKPQGLGLLHFDSEPMSIEEARKLLQHQTYFDYLKGRVMKVDLSGDELDPRLYDRDNGQGAAERVINALIATGSVNPEEAELQHLEGTRKAAQEARRGLDTKSSFREEGDWAVLELGLGEFGEELKPKIDEILGDQEEEAQG